LEVESPDNVESTNSATGAVSALTAVGTEMSFKDGKFYVAQPGDFAQYRLVKQMTPIVAGCVRIFVTRIQGTLVPA
jgi:hypothetical protein